MLIRTAVITFALTLATAKGQNSLGVKRVLLGSVQVNSKDGLEYRRIPPGTFQIGCSPRDNACSQGERPRRRVRHSKAFWIAGTEVTVAAYEKFLSSEGMTELTDNPSASRRSQCDLPAAMVTWSEASDYCAWAGGRLPTEAEWEYAARGGRDEQLYPWGNEISHAVANYGKGPSYPWEDRKGTIKGPQSRVSPVASYPPNAFGLYDSSGNVWEWTLDAYREDLYSTWPENHASIDPRGPDAGDKRVIRGGSFYEGPWHLRTSVRRGVDSGNRMKNVGFRCVLQAP